MPEGPTIVILKEAVQPFKGKKVIAVSGNTTIEKDRIVNEKIIDFKSWGKHFLICFKDFTLRVHFMLWGSYRVNEKRDRPTRLAIQFKNGELNLYSCSLRFIEETLDEVYDWSADVMNDKWDEAKARKKIKKQPEELVCDILLNQHIFSGVGNIIKNEVLFRILVHPESKIGSIPAKKLKSLLTEARHYSFQFYEWKKIFELKKHYLIYGRKICPRCNGPIRRRHLGKTNRRTFFCSNCQELYK